MAEGQNAATIDLIRWSFTVNPAHRAGIEEHLNDLGLDVLVRDDAQFLVTWDEPEGDIDEVIEAIWALNQTPFEIIQEEFHRDNLVTVNQEDDATAGEQAAA
jgi:hypothetical protein